MWRFFSWMSSGQVLQRFVEQILGCGRPCVLQRRVPAVQEVRVEGASDSVLPQSVGHSSCDAETGTHSANLHAPGAVLGGCAVVQRQVPAVAVC